MKVTRLHNESDVIALIAAINEAGKPVALDIETTGLDPWKDELLSIAITGPEPDSAYLFAPSLGALLPSLGVGLILHNFKFDYHFLYRKGVDLRSHSFRDTMLMHHLLDENQPHSLDYLIKERFNDAYKEKFWSAHKTYQEAPEAEQDTYAGKDVIYTLKVYEQLKEELASNGIPDALVRGVHDFALCLLDTEIKGVRLDLNRVAKAGVETLVKVNALEKEIRNDLSAEISSIEEDLYQKELAKRKTDKGKANVKRPEFSLGSTQQLNRLLYEELRLPVQFSPQRKPTVDDAALAKLEDEHVVISKIREWRGEQKIYSAFLESALEKARNGRIYPSFNINGTVTGRISASNPNLQQLPASGGIRGMYIPDEGMSFISSDYKQLEVTIAAHFSQDPSLLRVVNEGASLHDITAEGLGIDRKLAKTINFAIQYGAGVKKIQKILKCSPADAEDALERYWLTYPGLKKLIDRCHLCVDEGKALVNPFGRQRHLHVDNPSDKWAVAGVKRQAFNSLIQGTGADITNLAFTRISKQLISKVEGRGLFVVHDEILIEVIDESVLYWNSELTSVMSGIGKELNLTVPLSAEASGPMKRWED